MAGRLDIGALAVQLRADTRSFVSDLANGERAIGRVANAAKQSRTALAGFGSAFRAPGLGRAAAFGGVGSAAASALGFGALGGGLAGLTASGTFIALEKAIDFFRQQAERAANITKTIADSFAENQRRAQELADSIQSRQQSVDDIITDLVDPGGTQVRDRRQAIIDRINTVSQELARLREFRQFAVATFDSADIARADESIQRAEKALATLSEQFRSLQDAGPQKGLGLVGSGRISKDLAEAVDAASQKQAILAAATSASAAEQAALVADVIREESQRLRKEFQLQSDQVTTSINNISSQVLILQQRRER